MLPRTLARRLQPQLGLKIDATKLGIEILLVDRVEKPSEN